MGSNHSIHRLQLGDNGALWRGTGAAVENFRVTSHSFLIKFELGPVVLAQRLSREMRDAAFVAKEDGRLVSCILGWMRYGDIGL